MKSPRHARFDVAALRALSGGKVFARGEEYHRDGRVGILSDERERVLAHVMGSEVYRTVLTGRGGKIGGECSCPAFGDSGFCKHMVAVALTVNEAGDVERAEGPTALDRIRAHLKQKGIDALVGLVVDLAERDPALFRKLDIAAAAAATPRASKSNCGGRSTAPPARAASSTTARREAGRRTWTPPSTPSPSSRPAATPLWP